MNPGANTTLVFHARLLNEIPAGEIGRRDALLQSIDSAVILADDISQCSFDAPLPDSAWSICRNAGLFQWGPQRQWAELKEFQRNGPPPHEVAASLSWWLRFSGRNPVHAIVLLEDDERWIEGQWRVVLGVAASDRLKQQVQRTDPQDRAKRIYCATQSGWAGWIQGVAWFTSSEPPLRAAPERLGATPVGAEQTFFRVWAPRRKHVEVVWRRASIDSPHRTDLTRDADGYHTGFAPIGAGAEYQYALDTHLLRPDPVSRFQPRSVHEHSMVTSPSTFPWTDQQWKGVRKQDLVLYELHVGAFSSQGNYRGAIQRLPYLKDLGVSAIELLPLAQTPGRWNWGYDGVSLFAPNHNYGHPDDLKALVDACHREGIAVLLDVVYNHLGPEGNYLNDYGPYFAKKHHTPWGGAFNFDGWLSEYVRRFIIENAVYWLDEFHLDGLRLDAVHFMFDDSRPTILSEIRSATARVGRLFADGSHERGLAEHRSAERRAIHLIAEANMFDEALLTQDADCQPYDAIWCDCLMHSIYSLGVPDLNLTYREFRGAADIDEALQHGYLYEMPASSAENDTPQVTRTLLEHRASRHDDGDFRYLQSLVVALQTHDSVGNHPHGKRIHQLTSVEFQRAAAALVMLYPAIPMIFMGEEASVAAPFPFFADFGDQQLRKNVDQGRAREYSQHQWEGALAPSDPQAFYQAKCADEEYRDPRTLTWYRQLISLRKQGVAEGWLVPEQLHVESDVEHGVFMLRYDLNDGESYWVVSRLSASPADLRVWRFPRHGSVVLDSRQIGETVAQALEVQANHALVIRTTSPQRS